MLEKINCYAGWFTEKARRCSEKRYACFTLVNVPTDFIILEHSDDLEDMQQTLQENRYPNVSPQLIFDQEEQVVVQTMNDQLVLDSLIRLIENEILELEETGRLHAKWRDNRVCYFSRKLTSSQKQPLYEVV
jgi:hypothetical protein